MLTKMERACIVLGMRLENDQSYAAYIIERALAVTLETFDAAELAYSDALDRAIGALQDG